MRLIAVVVVALLSGCGSPATDPSATSQVAPSTGGPPGGTGATPSAGEPALTVSGCTQFHTFYPNPKALFEGEQPEGFALADSFVAGSDFTDVYVHWEFCSGGNETTALGGNVTVGSTNQFYAALVVVPPAGLAQELPLLDLVPLTWLSDPTTIAWLAKQNITAAEPGTFSRAPTLVQGPARTDRLGVIGADGTFDADVVLQLGGAAFPAVVYHMWVAPEGVAVGYIRLGLGQGESPTIGEGAAELTYQGDYTTGAPPASSGIAHAVEPIATRMTYTELPAAPPG